MSDTIRRIRSFVRREGRFTPGQQQAWERLMPQFGIEFSDQPLDFERLFGRDAPVTLEIGSGNGETLVTLAAAHPENDYIGIEVHRPGVGRLLRRIEELELSNVRVICHDAVEVVERMVLDASLDAVLLYFPDPWHKKRHTNAVSAAPIRRAALLQTQGHWSLPSGNRLGGLCPPYG
ncbi:tRNA (guanosine(46)-N7)-methyltransferase TrmB [Candidatus Reidiella endopervernicosa]|uniref:tRNA (guanosine(46)-N7)-methyltransferase TrmB n=1 Tax=Candidatus Reidiella endopervernicosa TaxID=2738883 RepID=UPI003B968984